MESIFNRPPSIAEDTLQYIIYPPSTSATSEAACAALGTQILDLIAQLLPSSVGFLWHRDGFEVRVVECGPHEMVASTGRSDDVDVSMEEGEKEKQWKLEGRMRVGDSVNDEWCVVWLLREVSKVLDVAVR